MGRELRQASIWQRTVERGGKGEVPSRDKSLEGSQECVRRKIPDKLQMNGFGSKTHEDGDVALCGLYSSAFRAAIKEGPTVVNPSAVEGGSGRDAGCWEVAHLLGLGGSHKSATTAAAFDYCLYSGAPIADPERAAQDGEGELCSAV